jgi:phosphoesterase RecJ-like protein
MIQKILDEIRKGQSFLITAHMRLDGDALGSELALQDALLRMGREAVVYNQDPAPSNYRFLPGVDRIVSVLEGIERFDAVFVLDCSELERVGDEAPRIGAMKRIINIDHHISNNGFCDLQLIEPHASSTGELVFRLLDGLGEPLSREAATNLYTAILTDTGGFRYGNTTRDALVIARQLVGGGADPQWISQHVYENNPRAKIELLSRALRSLAFDLNGRVGSVAVLLQDLEATGALQEHTEGLVDVPRSVEGTRVSMLLTQIEENRFKVSLRSKDDVDIERVARAFGGGGHINAAACRIEGDVETVKRRVLDEIRAAGIL